MRYHILHDTMLRAAFMVVMLSVAAPLTSIPGEAYAARAAGNVQRHPKKYVDKYLMARQRHARLAKAGLPAVSALALCGANYYKDSYSFDGKGIDSIIRRSNANVPDEVIEAYRRHITAWARHYKLPPLLVASVIHVESRFIETAYYVGNYGPMQVNLTVHRERLKALGIAVEELKTIEQGIHAGCDILRECIVGSGGDYTRALTWYNGAMNPHYAASVLQMYAFGKSAAQKN